MSKWSDPSKLKTLPNPDKRGYEIQIEVPELTFEGVGKQPDFGKLFIVIYPGERILELKSLKEYKDDLRNRIVSYERLANVVYDDLMQALQPIRLRLSLVLQPRGGIRSKLVIDSDWSTRGGKEVFADWKSNLPTQIVEEA